MIQSIVLIFRQVMKDGRITEAGKYSDILHAGTNFMELVGAHNKALSEVDSIQDGPANGGNSGSVQNGGVGTNGKVAREDESKASQKDEVIDNIGTKGQLVQEEEREKGKVGFAVYWRYITMAYGGALVPVILLAHILFQLLQIGSNYWMAWATPVSEDVKPAVTGSTLIAVYVALAAGSSLCVLVRATALATVGYKTATELFNRMHFCIFRAPMSFFDATPSGRILNRVCIIYSL